LAFELEKNGVNYLICTEQKSPLSNTSSLSYGHCRIPQRKDFKGIVRKSVLQLGENEKRMSFVYSRANLVMGLFEELGIDFEHRSFGIIPSSKGRGGKVILERLQQHISSFETQTELINFIKTDEAFEVYLRKKGMDIQVKSKYLVLATGGYGGTFKHTDNFRYKNYNIFDIVRNNGGKIKNLDCILTHPFGYNKGKNILIGNETKRGEFVDYRGNFIFDKKTRKLIKNDDYHEIFARILKRIDACRSGGYKVYFTNSRRKVEICPSIHYTAGGIKTDYLSQVIGCKNLFAIGECRADGSRNGGRLPGYPFTSSIVNGKVLGGKLSHK